MEETMRTLAGAIEAAEKACGLDFRFSHARILPRGAGAVEVEVSREEVWRAIPGGLAGFARRE